VAALATGAVLGLEGHIWYSFLDRIIAQATWRNVFKKVILDQTIVAPIYVVTYIIGMENKRLYSLKNVFFYFLFSRDFSSRGTNILSGVNK
jgi:hypothetical protein